MHLHVLFLGNVAAHLVTLMSGIVSFLIALYERGRSGKGRSHPIAAKWFFAISAICLFYACDQAWRDEHRNTEVVIAQKATAIGERDSCRADYRVEDEYAEGLQSLSNVQTRTVDQQGAALAAQQGSINSCVVSLGKMNPTLREHVNVIIVPLGTVDWKNRINVNALVRAYISELLIVTNEPGRFQGALKCHEGFVITRPPQVEPTGNAFETGPSVEPKMIATNEYEIGVRALGQEWGPSHPAYMQVKYFDRGLGPCTFTLEE